ncbi:MAG TPA: ribonuclease J [Anaerolineales bacterium]|nr:ribonuclease J [Anaerolineales bacterium]
MAEKKLRIIPIGGLGEVGKNMTVFEYGRNILIVDCGIMFPEFDMFGIDHIIPDWNYLKDKWDMVRGIVITHGHEDHIGALPNLLDNTSTTLYGTELTMTLAARKVANKSKEKNKFQSVKAGDTIKIGPFDVEFFHVCHSIPDACGIGITTPVGLVVHMGDFKLDTTPTDGWQTDMGKLNEFARRGVLCLLSDSTNANSPGWTPSEAVIDTAFEKVFRQAQGRILIATFSSLIARIQQAINAASKTNRRLALVGSSMVDNAKVCLKLGYLKDPNNVLISLDQALKMPDSKVVLMMTGSQGEPSSILSRISHGNNAQFDLKPGDTCVVSAHPIPGNEELVSRMINKLIRGGARVVYDPLETVHVSGHAHADEQKEILNLLRPRYFMPVHGELMQLRAHADLAVSAGMKEENIAVIENGQVLELSEDGMKLGERVPGGYVYVDGSGVGDIGPAVLRERDRLASDGFVVINLLVDADTRELVQDPEMISRGFVFVRDAQELFKIATRRVVQIAELNNTSDELRRRVEKDLNDFFYSETRRKPLVFVVVNEV